MAFLTRPASRPRHRQHQRLRLGLTLLAGAACLTPTVLAVNDDPLSSQIIPSDVRAPSAAAVTVIMAHEPAPTSLYSPHQGADPEELRLRPRAKDEEEEDNDSKSSKDSSSEDDDSKESKGSGSSKDENTDDEGKDGKSKSSKDEDEDGDASDKKGSSKDDEGDTGDDDGDDDGEDDEPKGTKTLDTDDKPAKTGTLTLSVTKSKATGEDAEPTESSLPVAFDGVIASEFKTEDEDDSCPNFIEGLLASKEFQRCYPLSMMMQTSSSFFQAEKQLVSIVRVLDATCAADVDSCSDFMDKAAKNLTSSDNCEAEWNEGLSTVMQAYRGLMAYEMMYTATCLQDPDDEDYCFASAVTNTSTPSDTFLYFLPYNLSLPGSSTPSCNWCIQETMGVFHSATADRRQLIATTYENAARQVNTICGSDFVNGTLAEESVSSNRGTLLLAPQAFVLLAALLLGSLFNWIP